MMALVEALAVVALAASGPAGAAQTKALPAWATAALALNQHCLMTKDWTADQCLAAFSTIEARAAEGDVRAETLVATVYEGGIVTGVNRDPAKALAWRRRAADQGDAGAQLSIALRYEVGLGVPRDPAQAVLWYRKAADQGDTLAYLRLADHYEKGEGVPQSLSDAFSWNLKAAEAGERDAAKTVGADYAYGKGVARDDVQAYAWLSVAMALSDADEQDAQRLALGAVADRLTPAQLAAAKLEADALKVKLDP